MKSKTFYGKYTFELDNQIDEFFRNSNTQITSSSLAVDEDGLYLNVLYTEKVKNEKDMGD